MLDKAKKHKSKGVLKDQLITVDYKQQNEPVLLRLRRVTYKAEDGRIYVFITNNWKISTSQVARIYKCRWMIELLFKQIKQNFLLRYFGGDSQNAIKTQIYCVLIAQLLMVVIRMKSATKKPFANMITVIRLHLMSYVELLSFIKDTCLAWRRANNPVLSSHRGELPQEGMLELRRWFFRRVR